MLVKARNHPYTENGPYYRESSLDRTKDRHRKYRRKLKKTHTSSHITNLLFVIFGALILFCPTWMLVRIFKNRYSIFGSFHSGMELDFILPSTASTSSDTKTVNNSPPGNLRSFPANFKVKSIVRDGDGDKLKFDLDVEMNLSDIDRVETIITNQKQSGNQLIEEEDIEKITTLDEATNKNESTQNKRVESSSEVRVGLQKTKKVAIALTAFLESPRSTDITSIKPLPVRNTTPSDLKELRYDHITYETACNESNISHGPGYGLYSNNKIASLFPVDKYPSGDPFLPWIHDSFVTTAMTTAGIEYDQNLEAPVVVRFIAHNARRCESRNLQRIKEYEPQVSLLQPVGVKKLEGTENQSPRYRLASHADASDDGKYTRFICRFHVHDNVGHETTIQTETLSTYPFNYEFVNWRKRRETMLTPDGTDGNDNAWYWLATTIFDCPIPTEVLPYVVADLDGNNGSMSTSKIYVDVVPIRTPARFGVNYFTEDLAGKPQHTRTEEKKNLQGWDAFDTDLNWGTKHILPEVQSSGRWANIPVCKPKGNFRFQTSDAVTNLPSRSSENLSLPNRTIPTVAKSTKKPHSLVACTWASIAFYRRGNNSSVRDGEDRLREWITFHLLAGFDHIYVYDNSGSFIESKYDKYDGSGEGYENLRSVTELFDKEKVTWVEWPSKVCNNSVNEKVGDRSSQYSAEASCRQRYGSLTDWMAFFDTDEYLIPMGNYTDMKDWLNNNTAIQNANILSFKSTRALPREDLMDHYEDGYKCTDKPDENCLKRSTNRTILQTYNCEKSVTAEQSDSEARKKQIYRTNFVLAHFVHYSTVTMRITRSKRWSEERNHNWFRHSRETSESERFTNENDEALMIHSKTVKPWDTLEDKWRGRPWPKNHAKDNDISNTTKFNCFVNEKIEEYWVPLVKKASR